MLWTRISRRRCYWSRCTFCTQNSKYDDPRPPTKSEVAGALDRIEAQITAGYRNIHFSDEAVSPALLRLFSQGVLERRLSFRWGCRCKLDPSQTPELFQLARAAGCYEIIFGLESISPRVQKLMDKYVEGLDRERIAAILRSVHDAGIALFINLIVGFPGDTPEEAEDSVAFLIATCGDFDNTTYVLNPFGLFPATPVMDDPAAFGVIPKEEPGDMVSAYRYELDPAIRASTLAAAQRMPEFRQRLDAAFGWDQLQLGPALDIVQALYFEMGHGAVLKALPANPLGRFATRTEADVV
ncbi:MAG: B12-binding domain-containing radical SAM protein [Alphaproteobacteria bacterium]